MGAPNRRPLRLVPAAAAILAGGLFSISAVSSLAIRTARTIIEAKRSKAALQCGVCRGKRFYICKLCKGDFTIHWSPLSDPIAINPCLCPTCDGNGVQRCLNCLAKGYY